jgi:streptomycin 3"-adenylyltransferase
MTQHGWSDCPADLRRQVGRLLAGFQAVLGENLLGVYLHGSLAMGCFNPLRSDLDLLAVTAEPMAAAARRDLAEFLLAVSRQPAPVEISFLTRDDLDPWRFPTPYDFHYGEDWRPDVTAALATGDWTRWDAQPRCDPDLAGHITVTRQRGICLAGLPISVAFPAVPPADYQASILADVLDAHFGLASDLSHPVYVILNACRTLAFLRTRQVMSKDEGGVWALAALPEPLRPGAAALLDAYRRRGDEGELSPETIAQLADHLRREIHRQ